MLQRRPRNKKAAHLIDNLKNRSVTLIDKLNLQSSVKGRFKSSNSRIRDEKEWILRHTPTPPSPYYLYPLSPPPPLSTVQHQLHRRAPSFPVPRRGPTYRYGPPNATHRAISSTHKPTAIGGWLRCPGRGGAGRGRGGCLPAGGGDAGWGVGTGGWDRQGARARSSSGRSLGSTMATSLISVRTPTPGWPGIGCPALVRPAWWKSGALWGAHPLSQRNLGCQEDLGKLDAKADIGIFIGYVPAKKAFRIYNKRTQKIIEIIHVTFDELTTMASEQFSSAPGLHFMTPATSNSRLVPNTVSRQPCIPPNRDDWNYLFQLMFDEYFTPPVIVVPLVQEATAPRAVVLADSLVSSSIDQDALSLSTPSTQEQEPSLNISQGFEESPKTLIFHDDPLNESPHEESTPQGSSSNVRQTYTPFEHLGKRTKDHPIANVIGDPSCSISTRKQLQTDDMWCFFDAFLTSVEPKNFKQAMTEPSWIDAMQEEIHDF
ncbi:integrase, catalytic region, zinc finger, CCHC-type containing protein [Tanacetum coccineum]|uniref:Integrase, catalytic region, zinc finger, CCHC-type containing protein n=1 Tax=Tanacetum coccineum TaxID=301880 RepID=A0ABQ5HNJ5_9ASTR